MYQHKKKAKYEAWNRLCKDLEQDLNGNKKLLYHMAKSYRKGNQDKSFNIKDSETYHILTARADIDKTWKEYFSKLFNPRNENTSNNFTGEECMDRLLVALTQSQKTKWKRLLNDQSMKDHLVQT